MTQPLAYSALVLALSIIGLAPTKATAAITITGLQITENSFSLSITGTLPTDAPGIYSNTLLLVNPNSQRPIFGSVSLLRASSSTSTTGIPLSQVSTGLPLQGNYIIIQNAADLLSGNTLNDTITGTWDGTPFSPEYFTDSNKLLLYWGNGATPAPTSGIFLAEISGPVPEPTTAALLSAGAAALLAVAVRRRRKA